MGTYGYSGSPVFLTVTAAGNYNITAYGAQGGTSQVGNAGGKGAAEGGTFTLTAGEHLEIVVGAMGKADTRANYGGGGGGGTFVFANTGAQRKLSVDFWPRAAAPADTPVSAPEVSPATRTRVRERAALGYGAGAGVKSSGNASAVDSGKNRSGQFAGGFTNGSYAGSKGSGGFGGGGAGGYGGGGGGYSGGHEGAKTSNTATGGTVFRGREF